MTKCIKKHHFDNFLIPFRAFYGTMVGHEKFGEVPSVSLGYHFNR